MISQQTSLRDALDSTDVINYTHQITGLNEQTVRTISAQLDEPEWMLEHRLASLKKFFELSFPKR